MLSLTLMRRGLVYSMGSRGVGDQDAMIFKIIYQQVVRDARGGSSGIGIWVSY